MEIEDAISMGVILLFLIFMVSLGLKIIFRPEIKKPKGTRKTDIRRLGFREREACDLYDYKNVLMLTELKIKSDIEFLHDQVEEVFVDIAKEHAILRCSIQTHARNEARRFFVPMEDDFYDIHCVGGKAWQEEVQKALRKRHDAQHGPLWSLIYRAEKNPGNGYEYCFALSYHPAILDQFSSRRILQLAVENLCNPRSSSEIQDSAPLLSSLDYLIKTRDLAERLRFGVFFFRCLYYQYSLMLTSSLKTRVVNRLKNTFANLPKNERQLYRDADKTTHIEQLVVNTGSKTALSETVKKFEVDARSLLLAAVKIAVATLKPPQDDDKDKAVTVRSTCAENARSLPGVELGEEAFGSYQFEHPLTVQVPWSNLKGKSDTLKSVALSCYSQTRNASTRRSCFTQVWDQHLLSKVIRPMVNWDKVLETSKGRSPTDIMFDFCDVSGDDMSSDITWGSTSLGLGRQGPLLYVSAAVIGQNVCLSLTYSPSVLKEAEITKVCHVIKETLLDTLA